MAFVVEDGTGKNNVNSYCSVADADAYHADFTESAQWTAASTATKQNALILATCEAALRIVTGGSVTIKQGASIANGTTLTTYNIEKTYEDLSNELALLLGMAPSGLTLTIPRTGSIWGGCGWSGARASGTCWCSKASERAGCMGNINALRSDLDKQVNGTWFPYEDGIELKIARWGNERFLQAQREIVEQRKVVLGARELTEEQRLDANKEAASRTILVDWRNLEDDAGPVAYAPGKALEFFRDPELGAFWTFVFVKSLEEANFRKERLEADLKNSSPS